MPTTAQLLVYGARLVGALVVVIQVSLIPLVLIRRKEASSAIAWILTLIFLPALGAFLFLLFGRDRVRMGAVNKRAAKEASRARMRGVLRGPVGKDIPALRQGGDEGAAGVRTVGEAPDRQTDVALAFAEAELEDRLSLLDPIDRPIFRVGGRLAHTTATRGNTVAVMSSGEDTIATKLAAIGEAQLSVHAEYYLVRDDATGLAFRDALIAAAKRGCRVRLLVDGYGGLALGSSYVEAFAAAGVEMNRFLPIRALGAGLHARLLGAFQWNLRNHRKILVIDGRIGFTGGVNVGNDVRRWRDTHVRIEGPAVHTLQAIFLEDWEFATGRHVADPQDFASFHPPPAPAPPPPSPPLPSAPPTSGVEPSLHESTGIVEIVASGPDTANEAIHRVFFSAVTSARERVYITTPYFVPDRALMVALETAALGGVDVRLIVPSRSNHRITAAAGRSYYEELLEAGVEIYEYMPAMIHAKTIVVDGRIALVGSACSDSSSSPQRWRA